MSCGAQQVRLNRQYDARLRRTTEQLSQEIQRVDDAAGTGTMAMNVDWIDLSPHTVTGTTTETIAAPTTTGQWFMRAIDSQATVTYKYKADFPVDRCIGEDVGGSPTEANFYTASIAGACLMGVSGKYKGNWAWYITKQSGFNVTSEP